MKKAVGEHDHRVDRGGKRCPEERPVGAQGHQGKGHHCRYQERDPDRKGENGKSEPGPAFGQPLGIRIVVAKKVVERLVGYVERQHHRQDEPCPPKTSFGRR